MSRLWLTAWTNCNRAAKFRLRIADCGLRIADRRSGLRPDLERKDEKDKEPNAKTITEAQRAVKYAIRNPPSAIRHRHDCSPTSPLAHADHHVVPVRQR